MSREVPIRPSSDRGSRLVFVTQLIDEHDPVLGFVIEWIRVLGNHCQVLVVIGNEVRRQPPDLPATVISLGKERGNGKVRRLSRYLTVLNDAAKAIRPDAFLAHMCPVYVNAAAPVLKAHRIPTMLWYAHPSHTLSLRMATRLSDTIITSLPGAFPFQHEKVRVIGQGIDVRRFRTDAPLTRGDVLRVLALGRPSPVKRLDVVVRAVSMLIDRGISARLRLVGSPTNRGERENREYLQSLVESLGMSDIASIEDGVIGSDVPALIQESDVVVNATAAGSGDKVVLESMSMGRPVVVSNPSFFGLIGGLPVRLRFEEGRSDDLADRLEELSRLGDAELSALAYELRERVALKHSLEGWARNVIVAVTELKQYR